MVESKGEGVRREHTGGVEPCGFAQETGEKSVCGDTGLQQFEAIQPEMPHSEVGHLPDQAAQGFLYDAVPAGTRLVEIEEHKPENPGRCNLRDTGWDDLAHGPRKDGLRLGDKIRKGCLHGVNRRVWIHHEVGIFGIGERIHLQVLAWAVGQNDLGLSMRQAIAPSPLAPLFQVPYHKAQARATRGPYATMVSRGAAVKEDRLSSPLSFPGITITLWSTFVGPPLPEGLLWSFNS